MSEHQGELKELKQEVAELWVRFRAEPVDVTDDEVRRALSAQAKTLEARRRALSERRTALRSQVDVARRRSSRLVPAMRFFGALVGVSAALGVALVFSPEVASWTLDFGVPHGAATLTGSLLVLAAAVCGGE